MGRSLAVPLLVGPRLFYQSFYQSLLLEYGNGRFNPRHSKVFDPDQSLVGFGGGILTLDEATKDPRESLAPSLARIEGRTD